MQYHFALLGMCGGIVRAFVGIAKAFRRNERLKWDYFLLTIILSAIIGAFTGFIYSESYKLSLIAGYAGMDLLEGAYKIVVNKK